MGYPYSMKTAVGYAIILLVLLWWLPIIGPIIIGYITGRKAGGPVKGVVAMLVPILLYFFLIYAISVGWVNVPPIFQNYFNGSIGSVSNAVFIPYLRETINTAFNIGIMAKSYLYYAPSSLFIMIAFAFIGGTMSRQLILERRYGLREVRKKNAPTILDVEERKKPTIRRKKRKAPEDLSRESKFVVHPMDTKKKVPVNREKRYGITFL